MLLEIKVYLISALYFFGFVFMLLFPPRNFVQSGAKLRTKRSDDSNLTVQKYVDPTSISRSIKLYAQDNVEVATAVSLTPITAENRTIMALELRSDRQSKKPGILIVGGLNGMAWGVSTAILELVEMLLYESSYQTPFFNDYDWYLIPSGNPDGLHFTQSMSVLPAVETDHWSKNLTIRKFTRPAQWHKNVDKESKDDLCFGTNINRNFAYHWQDDVPKKPERCSQFYPGVKPFSSAEAQAIRQYADRLGDTIHMAINLHASFEPKKEFILYPWRYSMRQPNNYRILQEIGEYAARHARLPDGRLYQVHQGSSDARVAGTFSDYLSGVVGIDLVYIIKPYHVLSPNYTDYKGIDVFVKKSVSAILSIVRGWRSSTKQNTLSFFGRNVEF